MVVGSNPQKKISWKDIFIFRFFFPAPKEKSFFMQDFMHQFPICKVYSKKKERPSKMAKS
jgi:hypothetical protein